MVTSSWVSPHSIAALIPEAGASPARARVFCESVDAVVDRLAAALDQTVGVHHQSVPGLDGEGARLHSVTFLRPIGGDSWIGACTAVTEFVRYGIKWPAHAASTCAGCEIDTRDDDGGERPGHQVLAEFVQLVERLGRIGADEQLRAQGISQLRHRSRRGDAMSGNVTENHDQPAVTQLECVVPVAAHATARRRLVMRGQLPILKCRNRIGQQAELHRLGHPQCATGAAVQRLDQMTAQRLGRFGLAQRPRVAALPHDLAPAFERLARTQPDFVALADGDRLVVRVAAPIHRTLYLATEPDGVLAVGQVERERPGGQLRVEGQRGHVPREALAAGDLLSRPARPCGDRGHGFWRRDRSTHLRVALDMDDDTVGGHEIEQVGRPQQRRRDRLVLAQRGGGELGQHGLRGEPFVQLVVLELVHQPQRQGRSEEFGRGPGAERRQMRPGVVVAGDEPPQPSPPQQRDRHRCVHTHVLQVLDVDRRHAAQRGVGQVAAAPRSPGRPPAPAASACSSRPR